LLRRAVRLVTVVCLSVLPAACASGGALAPAPHAPAGTSRTTKATFTIHWTNPSAPASVRRRDTISPSAQSVSVTVNGSLAAVANRNSGTQQQSFQFAAPVGTDAFVFNVYDAPNAQGNLLGSATVAQQIIDGAANSVSASIQAVCAVTNVSYAGDDPPSTFQTTSASGIQPPQLSQIELLGALPATLIVSPEDADGNLIIGSTTGQIAYQISGSASVVRVDGAHLALHPLSGPRSLTASTLSVVAPSCPSTAPVTIAVKRSPAIYIQTISIADPVYVFDWYGNLIETWTPPTGTTLIGWDTASHMLMAYNSATGEVTGITLAHNATLLYTIPGVPANDSATWSNYLHGPILAQQFTGLVGYSTYTQANGTVHIGTVNGNNVGLTASTFSSNPYVFAGLTTTLAEFTLTANGHTSGPPSSSSAVVNYSALAIDDQLATLYTFTLGTPGVCEFSYTLGLYGCSTFGFPGEALSGATDTDTDNIYAVVGGTLVGVTDSGVPLSGFTASTINGFPTSMFVISANEQ